MLNRVLIILVLFCSWLEAIQAEQHLSFRAQQLKAQVHSYIYNSDYSTAQRVVSNFLLEETLSQEEAFYGYFLQADITKSAGAPSSAIILLNDAEKLLSNLEKDKKALYQALLNGNIAECYFNMLEYENAASYAAKSIALHPTNELKKNGHAVNCLILGFVRRLAKNYTEAADYYQLAIDSYKSTHNQCDIPLCYLKMADLKAVQGQYKQASAYIDIAAKLSDSCKIDQYILLCQVTKIKLLEDQNYNKEALQVHKKAAKLRQKINKRDQLKLVSELQIKHQIDLAKAETEKLKQAALIIRQQTTLKFILLFISIAALLLLLFLRHNKNTKLKAQLEKINLQNKERESLLKEVHHRVKNNLQLITSLLHLQATDERSSQKDRSLLFNSSQSRINAMALVHEILYQSDNLSKISLPLYIKDLVHSIHKNAQNKQQISLNLEIPEVSLGLDTAIPLGLLLNELLSNAFVHGMKDPTKGKINIQIRALSEQRYELILGDEGIGLQGSSDLKQHSTLGLSLVRRLVRQLQGSIELLEQSPGCHYRIEFTAVD